MPVAQSTRISGTKEWSVSSANIILGCPHRCRYCYARARAVNYGQCPTHEAWGTTYWRVRPAEVDKRRKLIDGRIMFPSTHDLTPEHVGECIAVLRRILAAGNEVLIVSKPHLAVVQELCVALTPYRSRVLFRFTIGADDDAVLSYWEPGAPPFAERLAALTHAFRDGWDTSVSCEPLLDAPNAVRLFRTLSPFVTDSIWIGKMNEARRRCIPGTSAEAIARIEAGQTLESVRAIYAALKDEPMVRWKESYKEALGLDLAQEAGLDT